MTIWALSDLHLALSVPEKTMEYFGEGWKDYAARIEKNWKKHVQEEDLVLIAGDITWAMKPEDALIDLEWIHALPGKKIISKGNHDYWWPSNAKLKKMLPPSLSFVNGSAVSWNDVAICGTRLWDVPNLSFNAIIDYKENPRAREKKHDDTKIYERELQRLETALERLDPHATLRIAMVHYPPTSNDLQHTDITDLMEAYKIDHCIFGHLHNVLEGKAQFGARGGTTYHFTSADYLQFIPKKIWE